MTLNLSLSQIETIIQNEFQNVVQIMAYEFDLEESTVRTFLKENMEKQVTESAKIHYNRYKNASNFRGKID